MILKTIIVEDEPLSRTFLNNLLKEFCPQIEIVAMVATVKEAMEAISIAKPDLIFLDIELQDGTGFDVLQQTLPNDFQVIFTTALDHYAINAIRMSGVHYLQKPIDITELQEAIHRTVKEKAGFNSRIALNHLLETINNGGKSLHLFIPAHDGGTYILLTDIVSIEVIDEGSCLLLKHGMKKNTNLTLKEYETLLSSHSFFRPHQKHLINSREILSITDESEPYIIMKDGSSIPLSLKKKEALTFILNSASKP
jgi:two-component system LytT family response regulator